MKSSNTIILTLNCIKRVPWILGKFAFTVVLFLILVDLIFGITVLYNYVFSGNYPTQQTEKSAPIFTASVYREVVKELQVRDQHLQNILNGLK